MANTTQNAAAMAKTEQQDLAILRDRTMWNDVALMNTSWRAADMLSKTGIVPQQYRGKPGDCLIAIDMANRMGLSPIMVMQASQIVQGNFTFKGTACKALIDGCGKFKNSHYVMSGKPNAPDWSCRLVAVNIKTGETVYGPAVTWQMAIDEGWVNKGGSKWGTMPELMMRYRAASFFAKTECPEVLMGFQTTEEQMDIIGVDGSASVEQYFDMSANTPEKKPAKKADKPEPEQTPPADGNQTSLDDL